MLLQNDLLLRTATGASTERTPVWLMRQAGRILPQYRKLRASLSGFKELVERPDLACEVTLQPVDELGVDAAIIFSDILVIPEAMGLPFEMVPGKGPFFPTTIQSEQDIKNLTIVDRGSQIGYTIEAIRLTKAALNGRVPLIGFAGCPWTIFAYMLEGGGSKTFSKARRFLYEQPTAAHVLLSKITQSTIVYLKAQIEAGADIIQVFDSHAGILPHAQYKEFGLPYIRQICDAIDEVPKIVFAKGAYTSVPEIAQFDCQVIGVDWNMNPHKIRQQVGANKTLQGNLDPCLLYADRATIRKETRKMLETYGLGRHIANLGHGVYPDTPLDNVKCFVDTVQSYAFKAVALAE